MLTGTAISGRVSGRWQRRSGTWLCLPSMKVRRWLDGSPFFNLVVGVHTEQSVAELSRCLKAIELANGRKPGAPRFSPRTLDLDMLTYGNMDRPVDGVELPRPEILYNAFVLRPLSELAGDQRHPVDGRTYRELWLAYDRDQKLWPADFHWPG